MLISIKRNSIIKAFENFTKDENYDDEELEKNIIQHMRHI